MMKFFRKYMKHLLAVFMTLLLAVWLGGPALTSLLEAESDVGDEQVGEAFGEPVLLASFRQAANEAQILSIVLPSWGMPWLHVLAGMGLNNPQSLQLYAYQIRSTPLTEKEWYMLGLAAQHGGVSVPPEAVNRFKGWSQITPQLIAVVRERQKISLEQIDRVIQSFVRVLEMVGQACSAIKVSEADIQDLIRQTKERVRISMVMVDGSKFIDSSYEPTEAELKAHFDKYKDLAEFDAVGLEFGYQQPEVVQAEYIQVKADSLIQRQKISDKEAYDYWSTHKTEFLKPVEPPASQPTTSTAPATQPKPEAPKPYETFTEAKPKVIEQLQTTKAKGEALRIARDLIGQLGRPWANAPTTQPDSYKQPPESEMADDVYQKLIARLANRYGGVLKYGRTQLQDYQALKSVAEIGPARAMAETQQEIPFADAAFLVVGLESKPDDNPNYARYFRNVYETCPEAFVDYQGNAYLFRTVAARPKQALESLEPIREQLIKDMRALWAYGQAEREARKLADVAGKVGLEKALDQNADLKKRLGEKALVEPQAFARKRLYRYGLRTYVSPWMVPQVGSDTEFAETCFSLAGKTTTQPARVAVHEQEFRQRWLVVQFNEILPVTREEYDQQREGIAGFLRFERRVKLLTEWFDPDQIRARINWQDPPEDDPEEGA